MLYSYIYVNTYVLDPDRVRLKMLSKGDKAAAVRTCVLVQAATVLCSCEQFQGGDSVLVM